MPIEPVDKNPRKRLLFVVNVDWFFLSHRLPIAIEALRHGYEVHIATAITDGREALERAGIAVHPIKIDRSGTGPLAAMQLLWALVRLFRSVSPDIVHLVTIKPVLLGGIAARFARVPSVVAAVSGLGFIFLSPGFLASVRRWLVGRFYRTALSHSCMKVIFQNPQDAEMISQVARLADDKMVLIPGSGVDLRLFSPATTRHGPLVIMMASRLLRDKGVFEFVKAAESLRSEGYDVKKVRFVLVGAIDPDNPASLTLDDMHGIEAGGAIECWGHRKDMNQVLSEADVVVLPSYREGMPKVLLEAAATGCAVITTDVPGCRDAITPNVTGLLVTAKDADAIATAIKRFLENPSLRESMGNAGRKLAERKFGIEKVVNDHLAIYRELHTSCTSE